MEQLTALIAEKTGLSTEMSAQVAQVVFDFLKDKLPDPIAAQLDNFLGGGGGDDSGNDIADAVQGLSNFFG